MSALLCNAHFFTGYIFWFFIVPNLGNGRLLCFKRKTVRPILMLWVCCGYASGTNDAFTWRQELSSFVVFIKSNDVCKTSLWQLLGQSSCLFVVIKNNKEIKRKRKGKNTMRVKEKELSKIVVQHFSFIK